MDEKPPTVTDIVVGLMVTTGFMSLLTALPLGLLLSLRTSREDGWDFTWTAILGLVLTIGIAVTGMFFLFLTRAICRFRWGYWPDVFWPSKKSENSQKPHA